VAEDLAEGTYYEYHDNGNAHFEIEYERGKLHGAMHRWNEDGQLIYQATFEEDVRQGDYTRWHDNGEVMETGSYVDGLPHGMLTRYDKDGNVEAEMEFDHGEPVLSEEAEKQLALAKELEEAEEEAEE